MMGENENPAICISKTSALDSLHSLSGEVVKNEKDNYRRIEELHYISSSILTQYSGVIEDHGSIKENIEFCDKYFNAPKKIQNEHENSVKYHMEEIKMKKEIRELEKKLNSRLLQNQVISQEILALQKRKAITEEALCLAKKYYSSVWDMNINIEDSKEDQFTCIINFKFDCGMYPIKFVVDRNTQDIVAWDGSSLLTSDEESEIKERYSGTGHYFPKVLSELRLLALNKIKLFGS